MGISRDSRHKRRLTGGRMPIHKKKRAFEKGRPSANTKLTNEKRVRSVRVRGGNYKFRALRLNEGNFSWGSEGIAKKVKILDVVYNASNNELVRTKTLVKSAIVQIDSGPFKAWYAQHYATDLGKKTKKETTQETKKQSKQLLAKLQKRQKDRVIDQKVEDQFPQGRILAKISSRPGQSGRADGFILEGKELEFYIKKIEAKKR